VISFTPRLLVRKNEPRYLLDKWSLPPTAAQHIVTLKYLFRNEEALISRHSDIALDILDLGSIWGWVVSITPGPRYAPGKGPTIPIVQEAGWAHFPVFRLYQTIRPVPRLCVVFRNKYRVLWFGVVSPNLRTTHCRMSKTAYSIYSQLPSIYGGRLLYPQAEDAPCRGKSGPG
jgi:hypothetical protein